MNKLIILARYWNDIEWIQASLEHIEYWKADRVFIAEGNWDKNFTACSTDGTREILEEWVSKKGNAELLDNPRINDNYRDNQALISNIAMEKAGAVAGDWMQIIDCDHFYFKKDIDLFRALMQNKDFVFPVVPTLMFFTGIHEYYIKMDRNGSKLPYKILPGASWIPTNHLAVNQQMYYQMCPKVKSFTPSFKGYHYEGIRLPQRLADKYRIGDRKSPQDWKEGVNLKNQLPYKGEHPDFVLPTLKKLGHL